MVGWVFFYTENVLCLLVLSKNLKIADPILKLNYLNLQDRNVFILNKFCYGGTVVLLFGGHKTYLYNFDPKN